MQGIPSISSVLNIILVSFLFSCVIFYHHSRAAASRCRQKRKVWVQQLEKKADDLSTTNINLQV